MGLTLGSLFDGCYTITEDGRMYSNRSRKWLKPSTDRYGYLYYVVSINGERFTVKAHRAVALCYIPNPDNKPTVDHIDGNRTNNIVSNLRWATYKEQQSNEVTVERNKPIHDRTDYQMMGMKRNFGRRKTVVTKDGVIVGIYDSLLDAATHAGVNYPKASECANGKRKHVGGYGFAYIGQSV